MVTFKSMQLIINKKNPNNLNVQKHHKRQSDIWTQQTCTFINNSNIILGFYKHLLATKMRNEQVDPPFLSLLHFPPKSLARQQITWAKLKSSMQENSFIFILNCILKKMFSLPNTIDNELQTFLELLVPNVVRLKIII